MKEEIAKYRRLVESLSHKTERKDLKWAIGGQWQNSPEAQVGNYLIRLSSEETPEGEPVEVVTVLSDYGSTVIDTFTDGRIAPGLGENGPFYWSMMSQLRQTAYRQAVGADVALDALLNELEDDDTPF